MTVTNKCKFCGKVRPTLMTLDKNILGRKLEAVLENISGFQLAKLVITHVLVCQECAVSLVATENAIVRVREELSMLKKRAKWSRESGAARKSVCEEENTPTARLKKAKLKRVKKKSKNLEADGSSQATPKALKDNMCVVEVEQTPAEEKEEATPIATQTEALVVKQEDVEHTSANLEDDGSEEFPKALTNEKMPKERKNVVEDDQTSVEEKEEEETTSFATQREANLVKQDAEKTSKNLEADDSLQETPKALANEKTPKRRKLSVVEDDQVGVDEEDEEEEEFTPIATQTEAMLVKQNAAKNSKNLKADNSFQKITKARKNRSILSKERKVGVVEDDQAGVEETEEEEFTPIATQTEAMLVKQNAAKNSKNLKADNIFQKITKARKNKSILSKERKLSVVEDDQTPAEEEEAEGDYDAECETPTEQPNITPTKTKTKKRKRHNTSSQSTDNEQEQQQLSCGLCGKTFAAAYVLRAHMFKHHLDMKHKQCPNCQRTFRIQEKFELHVLNEKCINMPGKKKKRLISQSGH